MSLGEFDLIKRFFTRHLPQTSMTEIGIGDDCALLRIPENHFVAVTTDTLVAGTHFLPSISPNDLGYKTVAVNLSDLAACGAMPHWVSLALTLERIDETWLQGLSEGIFEALDEHGVELIGGDTTRGPLSLTLTAQGITPFGKQCLRRGAKVGDLIYVTGTLGDSAAGLTLLQNHCMTREYNKAQQYLCQRHVKPTARVKQGVALRDFASSMLDISDGLLGDLKHILRASRCGAKIDVNHIPLSDELIASFSYEDAREFALNGGEDYELCFTLPPHKQKDFEDYFTKNQWTYTCIGEITDKIGQLDLFGDERPYHCQRTSFDHFY